MLFAAMHNLPTHNDCNLALCHQEVLEYFICHCVHNLKLSHATIKLYLAGVRNMYITAGYANPLCNEHGNIYPRLQLLLRGVRKSCHPKPFTRLPVTGTMLRTISRKLGKGFFGVYLDSLILAACLLAFFGFLRCGEFTSASDYFDPEVHLTLQDFKFHTRKVLVTIKSSKTDPFRLGCVIPIFQNNTEICPYSALLRFYKIRTSISAGPLEPFFLLPKGTCLSRHIFLKLFSQVGAASNITLDGIRGHSWRIGAATTAAQAHTPDYLIQTLGRWKSLSYTRYTRISQSLICETQLRMATRALR
jgi:hypothetical protein